ncbi:MAG: radical SAM protein [Desulfobaccales bacterium]
MRYEGPIYRPPSEADSLLIQATVGCPHNRCTFCMVYKQTRFKIRPLPEIIEDLAEARTEFGDRVRTLFFPAGNTIAMPTRDLAALCAHARRLFPRLQRITVYGSSQFILRHGREGLKALAEAGLSRIHAGFESGEDELLAKVKKGATAAQHVQAGQWLREAGIELSAYIILGLAGPEGSRRHALASAQVINAAQPAFVRLRTLVPKINTPLLKDVLSGRFRLCSPHEVLKEARTLISAIEVPTQVVSDHYTNYLDLSGPLPEARERLLALIEAALSRPEDTFRPFFIGTQ